MRLYIPDVRSAHDALAEGVDTMSEMVVDLCLGNIAHVSRDRINVVLRKEAFPEIVLLTMKSSSRIQQQ